MENITSKTLRVALLKSGLSEYAIAKKIGIQQQNLYRAKTTHHELNDKFATLTQRANARIKDNEQIIFDLEQSNAALIFELLRYKKTAKNSGSNVIKLFG